MTPDEEDDDGPFLTTVLDPSGVTFDVQAVPMIVGDGPVVLGDEQGAAAQGLLGLVNRVLMRGRVRSNRRFAVFVYRGEPGGPIVAESIYRTREDATRAARTIAQAIEDGTFGQDG